MSNVLVATERNEKGKKVRRLGYVPGTIYGPGVEHNLHVQFEWKEINRFLANHSTGSKAKVKVNGKELFCVVKAVQYHTIKKNPLHVEFYASSEESLIKVTVPLRFSGKENLSSKRLVLNILQSEIEIQGALKDLPEAVEIDVSEMNEGNEIIMGNVPLPANVKLLSKEDVVVAKVVRAEAEPEAEANAEAEAETRAAV